MRDFGEALALWLFDRGVREDICAASLRTAWLEAPRSGVKVELPETERPSRPGHRSEDIAVEIPPSSAAGAAEAGSDSKRSRAGLVLAGAFMLGCFTAGAFVVHHFVTQPTPSPLGPVQAGVERGVAAQPVPAPKAAERGTQADAVEDDAAGPGEADAGEKDSSAEVKETLSVDEALGEAVPEKPKARRRSLQRPVKARKKSSGKSGAPRDFGF
jgi:hypothetical protein